MTPSSRFRPCVAVHGNYKENSHVHEVITLLCVNIFQILLQKNECHTRAHMLS